MFFPVLSHHALSPQQVPTRSIHKRSKRQGHTLRAGADATVSAAASVSSSSSPASSDLQQLKAELRASLEGVERGIFGAQASKRQEVALLVEALEAANPLVAPVRHLERLAGDWRLLYTTIQITVGVRELAAACGCVALHAAACIPELRAAAGMPEMAHTVTA